MLGEQVVGDEGAIGSHLAFGDHAGALDEQGRRNTGKAYRHPRLAVADDETDGDTVSLCLDRTLFDHAAEPHGAIWLRRIGGDVARHVEIGRLVPQRPDREECRDHQHDDRDGEQHEALVFGLDRGHQRSRAFSRRFSARRIDSQLQATSASVAPMPMA